MAGLHRYLVSLVLFVMSAASHAAPIAIAIHGGAGAVPRAELSAQKEAEVRADLERAARAGYLVLESGGSSLDAVAAAVVVLEDAPHFNAGKGAVFDHEGNNQLDASIMDGATLRAGAVAGLRRIKNPIQLARAVMERSPHVMLIGDGAEAFAQSIGMEFVDPSYFRTEYRWQQLQNALQAERLDPHAALLPGLYFGTVGAVALDKQGRLAAATSTGGMTNKRWGRVGDSPIIGAGTYANARCAVSATGWGEFYIRAAAAHDICARVSYGRASLRAAAQRVVTKVIPAMGGDGGVIAMDSEGRIAMPFNTEGMYRASIDRKGHLQVAIYRE